MEAIPYTNNPHQMPGRLRALADRIRNGYVDIDGPKGAAAQLEAWADEWETANPPPEPGWIEGTGEEGDGRPSRNQDGAFRCHCFEVIDVPWSPGRDFDCPVCHREFNSGGQLLAPREQWGEETGEHPADVARSF